MFGWIRISKEDLVHFRGLITPIQKWYDKQLETVVTMWDKVKMRELTINLSNVPSTPRQAQAKKKKKKNTKQ